MATARDVKEAKAAGLRVGDIVRYKDIVDPNDRKWRARIVELRGPRLLVSNDVMPEFRDWALPPSTSVMVDEVVKASRPGAKAKFASKRTTAGALRKQLRAQGITSPADLEWHGISASDPDNTPYWLHEDGSMEKIRASRPGAKAKMDLTDVQRKAGYKWRVAYTRQLGKDQYLGGPPVTMQDDLLFATESAARQWADTMLKKGWFKGQGGGPEKILKATVLMASRIGAKSTHEAPAQKPGRKVMAESDPAVSAKIRKLMAEGKPQKQAVAIALDMKRRGEI
jgi:hypothetical protein